MGHLTLTRHLDYETSQRHSLIITATDSGIPPLSANLTVFVEVQDINDNAPVFERNEYTLRISESLPINSQVRHRHIIKNIYFNHTYTGMYIFAKINTFIIGQ